MTTRIGIAAGMIRSAAEVPEGLLGLVNFITFGSFTLEPREGNKEPVYHFDERTSTSRNAVNLRNLGLRHFLDEELRPLCELLQSHGVEVRVSISPTKSGEVREMCRFISLHPHGSLIARLEVNAACPNHREGATLSEVLAHDPIAVEAILQETSGYRGSVSLKIAPKTEIRQLEWIVRVCSNHCVGIVSANTIRSSSVVDGQQVLSVLQCGMAGAPLFGHTIAQVSELRAMIDKLDEGDCKPELTGCGGILTADDARSVAAAGADELSIATLFYQFGTRGVQDLQVALNSE